MAEAMEDAAQGPLNMRQQAKELFRPVRRPPVTRSVIVFAPFDIWAGDLLQWQSRWDHTASDAGEGPYRYALILIDAFSRFVWAVPMRTKSADDLLKAYQAALAQAGRAPQKLWFDQEAGIKGKKFKAQLAKDNTELYHTFSESGSVLAERVIRTLGNWLQQELLARATPDWAAVLPDIVKRYNYDHKVRTIGMSPAEALKPANREAVWLKANGGTLLPNIPSSLQVGDHVRVALTRGPFEKRSRTFNWSGEVFRIIDKKDGRPDTFKLEDYSGEAIEGSFYASELQKTAAPDPDQEWAVESIVKTRKRASKEEALVRWLGWPEKYDSWEPVDNVRAFVKK
jgi:hypothetical protein